MLIIRCSGCRRKLIRYDKIGYGEVLRCYKSRISKNYSGAMVDGRLVCDCGKIIAMDVGDHLNMIRRAFTYSGTKRSG